LSVLNLCRLLVEKSERKNVYANLLKTLGIARAGRQCAGDYADDSENVTSSKYNLNSSKQCVKNLHRILAGTMSAGSGYTK